MREDAVFLCVQIFRNG